MRVASRADRWKSERPCARIENLLSSYCWAQRWNLKQEKKTFLGRRARTDRFGDIVSVLQPLGSTAYIILAAAFGKYGQSCSLWEVRIWVNPDKKHITNLSDYKLSPTEEFVLSHGLNFCLPPTNPKKEGIFAEFEVLITQLQHHRPQSPEKHSVLKVKLSDLAHAYCGTPVDASDFLMLKECLRAIKSLRSNRNILITKPDKGSGVVILNKTDYIKKMNSILADERKFLTLSPSSEKDNTSKIESQIQRRLLQLHKDDLLPTNLYDLIRPTGSLRPRMYGLPKTYKKDVPLRQILSMTGSAKHQLAKYLSYPTCSHSLFGQLHAGFFHLCWHH